MSRLNSNNNLIIDLELGNKLAGNKPELARELLQILIKNLSSDVSEIKQTYLDGDTKRLKSLVHKLHGATSYCGVPRLTTTLAQFTTSLKKHETEKLDSFLADVEFEAAQVLEKVSEIGIFP